MSEASAKRVGVSGASGFIGRRLCEVLQVRGRYVVALGRSKAEKGPWDEWVRIDLTGSEPVTLPKGLDTIFHLAGKAHALSEVSQDEDDYARVNTEGTRRLLDAAKAQGVRAFVFFSSVKAMGEVGGRGAVDEGWEGAPDTAYGRSKREAERWVLVGGHVVHPVVLRPCLVYGPAPKGNLEKMIAAIRRGRFPPLPEVGNRRSMVHVDDLIEAALVVAEDRRAAGQVFIVADRQPFSTRQLYVWISEALGRRIPGWTVPLPFLRLLGWLGDGLGRVRGRRFVFDSDALEKLIGNAWYTSAKLQTRLGWMPTRTMQATVPTMVGSRRND